MSKMNFKDFGLSEEVLRALDKLGYEKPSEVQEKVIPIALQQKDLIVKSQTGSGKTAAFAIPVCEKVEVEEKKPQVLVLAPTRELAVQVKEDISNMGRLKKVRCAAVYGKQPMEIQKRELKQRVHVIVGTPGRTLDHIDRGNVDLSEMRCLIIDEADEMLNMGFIDQVQAVMSKLPENKVTMLFSATMPEEIESLCDEHMKNAIKIEIEGKKLTAEKIEQFYFEVEEDDKFNLLNKVIYTERPDSCMIFCNTKDKVGNLTKSMRNKGYSCDGLHGGMEQKDRLDAMNRFKRGEFQFLVATDVAARGIDVEDVTHVVNYDVPMERESYVHRIGRTGRAGKEGKAMTFLCPRENRFLKDIEEYVGYEIPKNQMPSEEEVQKGKIIFNEKSKMKPKPKKDKGAGLNREVTKLHVSAGKKKKIRPGDIVGAITSIEGISAEDIGIIDVQDSCSYVDILGGKGKYVLEKLQDATIKGKQVRIQRARK